MICPRDARSSGSDSRVIDQGRPQVDVELERRSSSCPAPRTTPPMPMPARVHEDVHPAVSFGVRGDDADALVGVAEVRRHRERIELCGRLLERLGPPSDERELVPVLAQRASDARARSRTSRR